MEVAAIRASVNSKAEMVASLERQAREGKDQMERQRVKVAEMEDELQQRHAQAQVRRMARRSRAGGASARPWPDVA